MDVRPHPHIGLATVTYLFDGRIMHRDSEGNALEITPGAMNLMTAGSGIAHSERTPPTPAPPAAGMFGIQSWVALPAAQEETAPGFQHFSAASLPVVADRGVWARVIAGSAFGQTSPVGRCPTGCTPRCGWTPAPARRSIRTRRSARSTWSMARSASPARCSRGRAC